MLKSSAYALYTTVMAHFNCTTTRISNYITFATSIAVSHVEEYAFGKSPLVKVQLNYNNNNNIQLTKAVSNNHK
jgi:hypothetical protein